MFSELPTSPTTLSVSSTSTTAEQAEPTRTISSTEDWNRIWNSRLEQEEVVVVDNSLTVEAISKGSSPSTATQFTLRGEGQAGERITISTETPVGSSGSTYYGLVYLGVQNGTSISIENIDFQSELENENDKSGAAIYINNRTSSEYIFPTLDSINLNKLSFHGFNDKYVIAADADPGGKYNPFDGISNFNIQKCRLHRQLH